MDEHRARSPLGGKRRGSALGWAKREPTASRPPAWGERPRWGLGGRFSHKPPTRAGARLGSFSLSFSWGEKRDEPTDDQTARNRTRKPGATPPNRTAANPPRTGTVAQATFRCLVAVLCEAGKGRVGGESSRHRSNADRDNKRTTTRGGLACRGRMVKCAAGGGGDGGCVGGEWVGTGCRALGASSGESFLMFCKTAKMTTGGETKAKF